jgi:hypothetical protein
MAFSSVPVDQSFKLSVSQRTTFGVIHQLLISFFFKHIKTKTRYFRLGKYRVCIYNRFQNCIYQ